MKSVCSREETVGHWPVSGDEHTLQVLVLLSERQLQQEDVRGVQTVRRGGRQRKQQASLTFRSFCLKEHKTLGAAFGKFSKIVSKAFLLAALELSDPSSSR